MYDSASLCKVRRQALRNGVWYKALDGVDRALINLVAKFVKKPKSKLLIHILTKIIAKIQNAARNLQSDFVNQIGKPLARKVSLIAQSWGCKPAKEWAEDEGFSRYLAIMKLNFGPAERT